MRKNPMPVVITGLLAALICAASPLRADEPAKAAPPVGEDVVVNGTFEKGIESWYGNAMDFGLSDAERKDVPRPDFLSWEQKDTSDKSKGALRVTIKGIEKQKASSLQTGVVCTLTHPVPVGNEMRISFKAKSPVEGTFLQIERFGGGYRFGTFKLTTEWKEYEVIWMADYTMFGLNFTVIGSEAGRTNNKVIPGEFLVDDLKIIEVPKKAEEPKQEEPKKTE